VFVTDALEAAYGVKGQRLVWHRGQGDQVIQGAQDSRPVLDQRRIDEYEAVLTRAHELGGEPAALLLEVLSTYGWRPIDTCRLTCGSVDLGDVTLKATKYGDMVRPPLIADHAARLLSLAAVRKLEDRLFLDPSNHPWRISKLGQAEGLASWYTANIGEHLFGPQEDDTVPVEPGRTGIYLLKDRAISMMEDVGIDDRIKAGFTGHRTLRVFDHYRATNPLRQLAAVGKLAPRAKTEVKLKAAP
jgi:hypothetical protein